MPRGPVDDFLSHDAPAPARLCNITRIAPSIIHEPSAEYRPRAVTGSLANALSHSVIRASRMPRLALESRGTRIDRTSDRNWLDRPTKHGGAMRSATGAIDNSRAYDRPGWSRLACRTAKNQPAQNQALHGPDPGFRRQSGVAGLPPIAAAPSSGAQTQRLGPPADALAGQRSMHRQEFALGASEVKTSVSV